MENQIANGAVKAVRASALNCIDLSSSDIHQSVSLLKQVRSTSTFQPFYIVFIKNIWQVKKTTDDLYK